MTLNGLYGIKIACSIDIVEQLNLRNFTSSCLDKGINISSLKRS